MITKRILNYERIRQIPKSFSWIDHDFVNNGIIDVLTKEEILLYYFLVTVGDRSGISFYRREKICCKLKLGMDQYEKAKQSLIQYGLIAYKPFGKHSLNGYFQVLSLPQTNTEVDYEFRKTRDFSDPSTYGHWLFTAADSKRNGIKSSYSKKISN